MFSEFSLLKKHELFYMNCRTKNNKQHINMLHLHIFQKFLRSCTYGAILHTRNSMIKSENQHEEDNAEKATIKAVLLHEESTAEFCQNKSSLRLENHTYVDMLRIMRPRRSEQWSNYIACLLQYDGKQHFTPRENFCSMYDYLCSEEKVCRKGKSLLLSTIGSSPSKF